MGSIRPFRRLVLNIVGVAIWGVTSWHVAPYFLQALKELYKISSKWLLSAFRFLFFVFLILIFDVFRRWTGEKAISHSTGEFFSCATPKTKPLPKLEVKQIIIYHISHCPINDQLEIIYHIRSTGSKLLTKFLLFGSGEEIRFKYISEAPTLEELMHTFRYIVLDITDLAKPKKIPAILVKNRSENRIRLTFCLDPPIEPDKRKEAYIYVRLRRPTLWSTLRKFGEDKNCSFNFARLPPSKAVFLFHLPCLVNKAFVRYNGQKYDQIKNYIKFTAYGPDLRHVSYDINCHDFELWHLKLLRTLCNVIHFAWNIVEYFIPPLSIWSTRRFVKRRLKQIQNLIQEI